VIDGGRLFVIPDNSNVCLLQNDKALTHLKSYADAVRGNELKKLEDLTPKVDELVPELLRKCRTLRLD